MLLKLLFNKAPSALSHTKHLIKTRTFLSQAYYCNEVWEQRLNVPLIQKVNLDDVYQQLDQRYQKTRNISAVDVDIFANAVRDESFTDELLDLLHKLRMSADTTNMLNSTGHAAVRFLLNVGNTEQMFTILDDRLNYGVFLDCFTGNLLLNTFWNKKDYVSGARIASLFMLQEDFDNLLLSSLSLLHCYMFLLNPVGWPSLPPAPDEPEEEVKVRVKYLRNPYDDHHFDLKDPITIIGKTLSMITKDMNDTLDKSLHVLGLALYQNHHQIEAVTEMLSKNNEKLYEGILQCIPDEHAHKGTIIKLATEVGNVQGLLENRIRAAEQANAEKDIANQCEKYNTWEQEREETLKRQQERLSRITRLDAIVESQESLKEKEMLLWFFQNEEKLELDIEAKKVYYPKRWFGKIKKPRKVDEGYVPPEISVKYTS